MTSSDVGFELELDRVRDALRMIDAPTAGIISAIARMPLIRVFACLSELERRQLAFRHGVDQWSNT